MPEKGMRTGLTSEFCSQGVRKHQAPVMIREQARVPGQHFRLFVQEIRFSSR